MFATSLCVIAALLGGCDEGGESGRSRGSLPSPGGGGAEPGLGLEATGLGGQYVQNLSITGGSWTGIGGGDTVVITFRAEGMAEVRQFELDLEIEPFSAFVISESAFEPAEPFVTLFSGVEPVAGKNNRVKSGAAYLTNSDFVRGDAELGTLRLATSPDFSPRTEATIRVVFFSTGPNSGTRDNFLAADLNMELVVNGP